MIGIKRKTRAYLILTSFFYLLLNLHANSAFALPTPDVLLSAFQIFPLVISTLIGLFTGMGIYFRKRLDKLENPIGTLMKISTLFFLCLITSFIIIAYYVLQNEKEVRISNIAMYFRSDNNLDTLEIRARNEMEQWFTSGIVKELPYIKLTQFREHPFEPVFVDLDRLQLSHDSGFLAIPYDKELKISIYKRPSELCEYLENILADNKGGPERPVIFYHWDTFTMWRPFSESQRLISILKKFRHVYALPQTDLNFMIKISEEYPSIKVCVQNSKTGLIEETKNIRGVIDYPVRFDGIAYNEQAVNYPNLLKLLPASDFIDIIDDSEILIIAPFNSNYRARRYMNII